MRAVTLKDFEDGVVFLMLFLNSTPFDERPKTIHKQLQEGLFLGENKTKDLVFSSLSMVGLKPDGRRVVGLG